MTTDQQKWDQRYRDKAMLLPLPHRFIEKSVALLQPGTVVDIACGDGGNALYLARRGFDVVAVDISAEALERLQHFAMMLGVTVRTVQLDLQQDDWLAMLNEVVPGAINNMVITRYRPGLKLWRQMAERLSPDGVLLLSSFNMQQHHQFGFNADYCLQPAEYTGISPHLMLRFSASVRHENEHSDEYMFVRVDKA